MNEIIEIKKTTIEQEEYLYPVFNYYENALALVLMYSRGNVQKILLKELDQICIELEKNKEEYSFEIIDDEKSEAERDLPVYLREDTGFRLGKIIHLHSFFHEIYIYYKIEGDEIALVRYVAGLESQLRLFKRSHFIEICKKWNTKLNSISRK